MACTPLGTTTPLLGLCKPAQGETNWAAALNGNWDILDGVAAGVVLGAYQLRGLIGQNDAATPNTKFGYSADLVALRNPVTGTVIIRTAVATLTNTITVAGPVVDGRDQAGAFGANTWVHFYFIWNGVTLATLSSAAAPPNGPTLPATYTHWAYAGAVRYNGAPVLVKTRWRGSWAFTEAAQAAVTASAATTEQTTGLTAFVPPNALNMILSVKQAPTALWDTVDPVIGLTGTVSLKLVAGVTFITLDADVQGINISGTARVTASGQVTMPNLSQQLIWQAAAACASAGVCTPATSTSISVVGWTMPNGGE